MFCYSLPGDSAPRYRKFGLWAKDCPITGDIRAGSSDVYVDHLYYSGRNIIVKIDNNTYTFKTIPSQPVTTALSMGNNGLYNPFYENSYTGDYWICEYCGKDLSKTVNFSYQYLSNICNRWVVIDTNNNRIFNGIVFNHFASAGKSGFAPNGKVSNFYAKQKTTNWPISSIIHENLNADAPRWLAIKWNNPRAGHTIKIGIFTVVSSIQSPDTQTGGMDLNTNIQTNSVYFTEADSTVYESAYNNTARTENNTATIEGSKSNSIHYCFNPTYKFADLYKSAYITWLNDNIPPGHQKTESIKNVLNYNLKSTMGYNGTVEQFILNNWPSANIYRQCVVNYNEFTYTTTTNFDWLDVVPTINSSYSIVGYDFPALCFHHFAIAILDIT